jgi:hypothetical protein
MQYRRLNRGLLQFAQANTLPNIFTSSRKTMMMRDDSLQSPFQLGVAFVFVAGTADLKSLLSLKRRRHATYLKIPFRK